MNAKTIVDTLDQQYPNLWEKLDEIVTDEAYFEIFKKLSDNYSPTLTVSRVQGPLVKSLIAKTISPDSPSPVQVDASLRRSGTIGITIGSEPAPVWLTGHADICSYLTGDYDGTGYPLTPFCMTRAAPGRRAAVALGSPTQGQPLERLAEGEMVTLENGDTLFETAVATLPRWTKVIYDISASWNRENDELYGYIDNQGTCAALVLAAQVLSHYPVNVLLLLNDEEEGPVDKGNQGFSRAMLRLLNRTPLEQLPEGIFNSDAHQQEILIDAGRPSQFGDGALFTGMSSLTRGAVVPPQLVDFAREMTDELATRNIRFAENKSYVGRSDDISAMQYTQSVMLFGFAGTSSHFDKTPTMHCADLVELTKTLVVYALIAQDADWRAEYL
jgi:hypothetical protein